MLNDLPKVTRSLVEIPKETPPCPAALSVHIHVPNAETWGGGGGWWQGDSNVSWFAWDAPTGFSIESSTSQEPLQSGQTQTDGHNLQKPQPC